MNNREFFTNLIISFLNGDLTRAEVAYEVCVNIPIDKDFEEEEDELLVNCEESLRHINESPYETTEREIKYYLDCLQGRKTFSVVERDHVIKTGTV